MALFGILLLAPLLIICYFVTVLGSPGPALFRHRRVGLNGKHFDCLKFRTMVVHEPDGQTTASALLKMRTKRSASGRTLSNSGFRRSGTTP